MAARSRWAQHDAGTFVVPQALGVQAVAAQAHGQHDDQPQQHPLCALTLHPSVPFRNAASVQPPAIVSSWRDPVDRAAAARRARRRRRMRPSPDTVAYAAATPPMTSTVNTGRESTRRDTTQAVEPHRPAIDPHRHLVAPVR